MRRFFTYGCGVAALICSMMAAGSAAAQGAGAAPGAGSAGGTGSVIGVAEDSLHGGPLANATVTVVQLPQRTTRTTGAGAFRLDGLPAGRYTLALTHPVIDSLGIRVVSDTLTVTPGAPHAVELAVPSAAGVVAAACPAIRRRLGPGAIVGRVDDAVTGRPAAGARVSVAWVETEVGTDVGIRSMPRVREDRVAADGTYRICGLPVTLNATLQAERSGAKTAEVQIETTEEPLVVRDLHIPPPAVASGDSGAAPARPAVTAIITGTVTNAGGVPVPDATVTVQGTNATASTRRDGSFTVTGVPPGTQAVLVRHLGYTPVQLPIDVKTAGANPLVVRLGAYTPQLARVEVQAKSSAGLDANGFLRRQKSGMGRYLDEDQIEQIRPTYTTDVLRRIPGLYVTGQGASAAVYTTRGYTCVNFLIDRNPVHVGQGQSIDMLVNPQDVAAVEFYNPSTAPLELSSGADSGCALLAIWTKSGLKAPAKK